MEQILLLGFQDFRQGLLAGRLQFRTYIQPSASAGVLSAGSQSDRETIINNRCCPS